jgi:hypothetical protein
MKFAVDVPNHGEYSDPMLLLELAQEVEAAGWDGFFIWDHIAKSSDRSLPVVDPWVVLSAVAVKTSRILLGPMITPIARRRPWKLARETVSLDRLSDGRLILGVGLGARSSAEFSVFGDEGEPLVRAAMLDEALEILEGLWRGKPFAYHGVHYQIEETIFQPKPIQSPRIPIWVGGTWPHKKPLQRAVRWDGAFLIGAGHSYVEMLAPGEIEDVISEIKKLRLLDDHFEIVHLGITPGKDLQEDEHIVAAYADLGVTWWLENINPQRGTLDQMRKRIRRGPPNSAISFDK